MDVPLFHMSGRLPEPSTICLTRAKKAPVSAQPEALRCSLAPVPLSGPCLCSAGPAYIAHRWGSPVLNRYGGIAGVALFHDNLGEVGNERLCPRAVEEALRGTLFADPSRKSVVFVSNWRPRQSDQTDEEIHYA